MRRKNFLPFFIVFFALSLLLILIGESGIFTSLSSIVNKGADPLRLGVFNILTLRSLRDQTIENLTSENKKLRQNLVEKQNLANENQALRNQFENTNLPPSSLLPAKIVGAPGFIPGENLPQYLVIDKGSREGVGIGSTIIVENYLVGKVIGVSNNFSKVELVVNKNTSFTAKISEEGETVGIIKGQGNQGLTLENVLLSKSLKKGQIVLTKGEKDESGLGYPPDLIVGQIQTVEKKSSELFQKAKVASFINFVNLTTVFVIR